MKKKLISSYFLIIIVAVFVTAFFQAQFSRKIYLDEVKNRLANNSYAVKWVFNSTSISYKRIVNELSQKIADRITLIDSNGKVIIDSEVDASKLENHKNRPEVKSAFKGKKAFSIRYSKSTGQNMLYYAVPINLKHSNENGAVLRLSIALKDIEVLFNKLYEYVIIDMIFGVFVGILIAYFYTRRISKPIGEMVKTSKYIAQGNFETKLEVNTNDEFAVLGASFNFMVDALNNLIVELKSRNSEIESILNSMITGVIGIDVNHKILYVNPMAKKWFNVDYENFKGKNILDIVRSSSLDKAIVDALDKNRKNLENVVIQNGNRYYKIYINLMKFEEKTEGAVIVIQDVTEEKNYSEMKTEFVANVSHELKTPLTSIMGFIETLKDVEIDDIETRDKFLGIIESESKRLQNIINDLLDISYLENNKTKVENLEVSEVKLDELINEVILILSKASLSKKIKIQSDCDEKIIFSANKDKLKQLFINLVDNSIKYNVINGNVFIRVREKENENDLVIVVEDTGIGIPKEHIDRLFERFYRVDKSRSRAQGGTGLGLAIVKHIVMSMNGKIEVISEVGKGTKFIVSLPKMSLKNNF